MATENPNTPPRMPCSATVTKEVEEIKEVEHSESSESHKQLYYDPGFEVGDIEDVEDYRPGGFHPIDMFDTLLDDRFEVIHKLGSGGMATVWLCYEKAIKKWKAIKINVADRSKDDSPELKVAKVLEKSIDTSQLLENYHIAMPLETFWVEGPNGRHLCTVLPVMGPTLSAWRHMSLGTDADRINDVCYQLTKGLDYLHSHGICHGDFRPENILMQLKGNGLDDLVPEDLFERLHYPSKEEILTLEEGERGPHAPKWVVDPLWWSELKEYVSDDVAIVDFGEAFEKSQPPKSLGIPRSYAAPEVTYGAMQLGMGCDIWSLAYTILKTRTGMSLHPSFYSSLSRMERFAGPIPAPYRRTAAEKLYEEEMRGAGKKGEMEKSSSSSEMLEADGKTLKSLTRETSGESCVRELELELGIELWERELVSDEEKEEGNTRKYKSVHCRLPQDEVASLADLLSKMFMYQPGQRIKAGIALKHPWFKKRAESIPESSAVGENDHTTSVQESLPVNTSQPTRLADLWEAVQQFLSVAATKITESVIAWAVVLLILTVMYHLFGSDPLCQRVEITKIIVL
ncbi:kinase-like protein [Xylaria telfairii]|nr:kinase-like protein [Xylaria telfairii]